MSRWLIENIDIAGGFLGGLKLQFPPQLTCIIGARGSGKSTLAEALRFAILGPGSSTSPRYPLLKANLGTSVVSMNAIRKLDATELQIRRVFGQPALLNGMDGRPIASVDLDRGTFLPLDVYSAQNVEDIAQETFGDKRRILLDELRSEDFHEIAQQLSGRKRELEANADEIRNTSRLITDLSERIEELSDARARVASLPLLSKDDKETGELTRAAAQNRLNDVEDRSVTVLLQRLSAARQQLSTLSQSLDPKSFTVDPTTQNKSTLAAIEGVLVNASNQMASSFRNIEKALIGLENELQTKHNELKAAHAAQRAHYTSLQEKNRVAGLAVQERSKAEQAVIALEDAERLRAEAKLKLIELRNSRNAIRGKYLLERDRISALREQIAYELEAKAGGRVRIRIYKNADLTTYEQLLAEGLRGARLRNHEEILKCLTRLRPEQFAQILGANDLAELELQTDLGAERCRKILESCRASIDPLTLEILAIDDRVGIELNVGSDSSPNFKDASNLSSGQKCTALLPLLMARRESPLVIDQPEDNLDNHFIYETVVESIVRLKSLRQMIFITHNANIPVLAEAELIVVLDSDGIHGFVRKSGTLDECREEIIDLLEGGKHAFELRRQRYAR